jgi:hypothetical protein
MLSESVLARRVSPTRLVPAAIALWHNPRCGRLRRARRASRTDQRWGRMMRETEALRLELGLPDAPLVNSGLAVTAQFFRTVIGADPMKWLPYLKGIDFHREVRQVRLDKDKTLVRYESADRREIRELTPFGYFTEPGVSPFHTGTSWPAWNYKKFNVVVPTSALLSTASSISFSRTDRVSRQGGGIQYIVSRSDWPKLIHVSETKRAN